jgi:hypothetical protein
MTYTAPPITFLFQTTAGFAMKKTCRRTTTPTSTAHLDNLFRGLGSNPISPSTDCWHHRDMTSPHWENESRTADILRRIVELAREASKDHGTKDNVQAGKESDRMAKIIMQMAMSALNASDDQQGAVESIIMRRLAEEKERRKAEGAKGQTRVGREFYERERYWEQEIDRVRQSVERRMVEEREKECEWQEVKYEAMRKRDEAERRSIEQGAADAVKKAQVEVARAQKEAELARQEALEARQEVDREKQRADQAEKAQRKQAKKDKADRQILEEQQESIAWSRYESQWRLLRQISAVVVNGDIIRFEDIPWPTVIPPTSPDMITIQEVGGFLFSGPALEEGRTLKSRIKDCLLTWHPDKFSGR